MKNMKKFKAVYHSLSRLQRIEFIAASVITMLLFIAVPVYSWFAFSDRLETLTRILTPESLDIRAGNKDPIENFDLTDIDIESLQEGGTKSYVFCVKTGELGSLYDIQLAYTTNIPFTYTLYRAEETSDPSEVDVIYAPIADETDQTMYKKNGSALNLQILNGDTTSESYYGRLLAKNSDGYFNKTYDAEDDGTPEIYAIPLYSQVTIAAENANDYDFFILELSWNESASSTAFNKWNKATNNKETDMIYISASKHTS